jgi:hypothetical protein
VEATKINHLEEVSSLIFLVGFSEKEYFFVVVSIFSKT